MSSSHKCLGIADSRDQLPMVSICWTERAYTLVYLHGTAQKGPVGLMTALTPAFPENRSQRPCAKPYQNIHLQGRDFRFPLILSFSFLSCNMESRWLLKITRFGPTKYWGFPIYLDWRAHLLGSTLDSHLLRWRVLSLFSLCISGLTRYGKTEKKCPTLNNVRYKANF